MDKKSMLDAMINHYTNGNKAKFASFLGMSAQTISAWGTRNTFDPELIYTKCVGISSAWLLTGEGPMFRSETTPSSDSLPAINQEYQGAPYFNVDFIGGFELVDNDQTQNPDYYINYPPYNKEGVMWCNLTGHSMEPEISNGDVIALKAMTSPIEYLPSGEIYAIVTDDYRTVKRIRVSERPGFIHLIPSNPSREFREQEIPVEMIRKVYAVLGSIRKFF